MQTISTTFGKLLVAAFIVALALFSTNRDFENRQGVVKPIHYALAPAVVPEIWQPFRPKEGQDEAKPAGTAEDHRQAAKYHQKRARHHARLARAYRSAALQEQRRISQFYRRVAEAHQQMAEQNDEAARVHSSLAKELGEEKHKREPVMDEWKGDKCYARRETRFLRGRSRPWWTCHGGASVSGRL